MSGKLQLKRGLKYERFCGIIKADELRGRFMENKIFTVNIADLGISQLYINKEKLDRVSEWFDADRASEYEPLPVYDFENGRYTLTDGHTRAYTMLKNGMQTVRVKLDCDEMITCDLGQKLYKTDIDWCEKYGMRGVGDFENRVISAEQYSVLWLERCKRLYNLLSSDLSADNVRNKFPDLLLYGASQDLSELYFDDCRGGFYLYKNGVLQEERKARW